MLHHMKQNHNKRLGPASEPRMCLYPETNIPYNCRYFTDTSLMCVASRTAPPQTDVKNVESDELIQHASPLGP